MFRIQRFVEGGDTSTQCDLSSVWTELELADNSSVFTNVQNATVFQDSGLLRHSWPVLVSVFLLFMTPNRSGAQEVARDFDDLRVKAGTAVEVVDTSGRTLRGRFLRVNGDSLTVITDARAAESIDESSTAIVSRVGDSVWSGTLIGFVVGLGFTIGVGIAEGCVWNCKGFGPGFGGALMVYGGIAAGIGALTDWLVHGRTEVFRATQHSAEVRLAPVVERGRKGVVMSIAFR
jgi:hypothetical protein